MLKRFQDRRVLLEALERQPFVSCDRKFAEEIAAVGNLQEWAEGQSIIEQHGSDRDLFLILLGQFSIVVYGREIALRVAGQHVGEMALLDHSAIRSASVIARAPSVTFKISEADFVRLANAKPAAWRAIASELGQRLRQRSQYVRARNTTPIIFVGSSSESLPIVNAIQIILAHDPFIIRPWTQGVFGASKFPIEDLQTQINESDFALLVIGPDDKVVGGSLFTLLAALLAFPEQLHTFLRRLPGIQNEAACFINSSHPIPKKDPQTKLYIA